MIAALSKKLNAPLGAIEVEAKAFGVCFQFAKDMGIQEIFVMEGDSLTMIHVLNEQSPPSLSVTSVVYGILSFLLDFCRVAFSHDRMQDNKSAHLLTKNVLEIDNFFVWIEENSYFLEYIFFYDIISFNRFFIVE